MPKVDALPDRLRLFQFHGVELEWRGGSSEAYGECPFCRADHEAKFYVNPVEGLWQCKRGECGAAGSWEGFLKALWEDNYGKVDEKRLTALRDRRGLLSAETLAAWGVAYNAVGQDWVIPAYSPKSGRMANLYRYVQPKEGRTLLLASPGLEACPFGVDLMKDRQTVYVCEGPWDAMALWEVLAGAKDLGEGKMVATSNAGVSLLAGADVLGVPGCKTFNRDWLPLFQGKDVVLLYDNDEGGYDGMRRAAGLLAGVAESVSYLAWAGEGGGKYDANLPQGYDVRDHFTNAGGRKSERIPALPRLLERVLPVPESWSKSHRGAGPVGGGGSNLDTLPCTDWATLWNAWLKAFKHTEGLRRTLPVMLASILSTEAVGDQLWVKVIGPPACGKSTLCEALGLAKQYVLMKDTFTGLTSGMRPDDGKESLSLVDDLRNMTLVINDGDTLLRLPNREQVMSQMRAFYGRNLRTSYRNKMSKDHVGINCTIILCGTNSLHELDTSELGERYLTVDMGRMSREAERDVALRKGFQALQELAFRSDGTVASRDSPHLVEAKRLTSGYVEYLRRHDLDLIARVKMDEACVEQCVNLGEFVSYMRARPSRKQDEETEREMATRLTSQLVRLAVCLAAVLNKQVVDAFVMAEVRQIALDTSRGRTLKAMKLFHDQEREEIPGLDINQLGHRLKVDFKGDEKVFNLLQFFFKLGIVEPFEWETHEGCQKQGLWRMTDVMRELYREVVGE